MSEAIFRENAMQPVRRRSRFEAPFDRGDVAFTLGAIFVTIGLGLAWLPLGLVFAGGVLMVVPLITDASKRRVR